MTLAKEGVGFLKSGTSLVVNIAGLATSNKLSQFLGFLGPVAISISLGLSVLTMGQRFLDGKPLFEQTDHEKQMEAIQQVANKVEDLDSKMEYLFDKRTKISQLLTSKAMNQRNEEKMYYAVHMHKKLTGVCTDRSTLQEGLDEEMNQPKVLGKGLLQKVRFV